MMMDATIVPMAAPRAQMSRWLENAGERSQRGFDVEFVVARDAKEHVVDGSALFARLQQLQKGRIEERARFERGYERVAAAQRFDDAAQTVTVDEPLDNAGAGFDRADDVDAGAQERAQRPRKARRRRSSRRRAQERRPKAQAVEQPPPTDRPNLVTAQRNRGEQEQCAGGDPNPAIFQHARGRNEQPRPKPEAARASRKTWLRMPASCSRRERGPGR